MTPEEARQTIIDRAGDECHLYWAQPIVDMVLADVPLLMQALGAKHERGRLFIRWPPPRIQRWITPWREVQP